MSANNDKPIYKQGQVKVYYYEDEESLKEIQYNAPPNGTMGIKVQQDGTLLIAEGYDIGTEQGREAIVAGFAPGAWDSFTLSPLEFVKRLSVPTDGVVKPFGPPDERGA